MEIKNCKCGSNRILRCHDSTIWPNKYWLECLDCGFIGGIIFSKQTFAMEITLQDGTKIIESPKNESIELWNEEVEV